MSNSLAGKTIFITGGSRGIGLAIAKRAAADGANIVIAAKTVEPHPRLAGTIHSAAAEIEAAGGHVLPVACDIREEDQVEAAVAAAVERFGGIDICINNASAIRLTGTLDTEVKRFDLMFGVNARGTFLTTQKCLPHLRLATNPHVLMIAPPLDMEERWFAPHVAYSIAKYGMSLCVLGMAGEFRADGIAVNALWPRTAIDTAAMNEFQDGMYTSQALRSPAIMADAAHAVLTMPSSAGTGRFYIDDEVLTARGITDIAARYNPPGVADEDVSPDFFVRSLREIRQANGGQEPLTAVVGNVA